MALLPEGTSAPSSHETMLPSTVRMTELEGKQLKWPDSLCRPALPDREGCGYGPRPPDLELGRSQAVRQRILIPPFGGSIPPAPARSPARLKLLTKPAWLGSCCTALRHTAAQGVVCDGFPHLSTGRGVLLAAPGAPRACQSFG